MSGWTGGVEMLRDTAKSRSVLSAWSSSARKLGMSVDEHGHRAIATGSDQAWREAKALPHPPMVAWVWDGEPRTHAEIVWAKSGWLGVRSSPFGPADRDRRANGNHGFRDIASKLVGASAERIEAELLEAFAAGQGQSEAVLVSLSEARKDYKRTHWGDRGRKKAPVLKVADPGEGVGVELGSLVQVVYATKKGRGPVEEFEHDFGEPQPRLLYSVRSRLLLVAGGAYSVDWRGIVG